MEMGMEMEMEMEMETDHGDGDGDGNGDGDGAGVRTEKTNGELENASMNDEIACETIMNVQMRSIDDNNANNARDCCVLSVAQANDFTGKWKHELKSEGEMRFLTRTTMLYTAFMGIRNTHFLFSIDAETRTTLVQIPYEDERFSLLLVMPPLMHRDRLSFRTVDIQRMSSSMRSTQLNLKMPKFMFKTESNLISLLRAMGSNKLFDGGSVSSSSSSSLSSNNEDLLDMFDEISASSEMKSKFTSIIAVNEALQKVDIAMDETGTVSPQSFDSGFDEKPRFRAIQRFTRNVYFDRPFYFQINFEISQGLQPIVLFSGVFVNPAHEK